MSNAPFDRSETARLLAKVHAHIACGDLDSARIFARLLYKAMADAGLLEKPRTILKV